MGHVIARPRDNHRAAFRGSGELLLAFPNLSRLASNSAGLAAREDIAMNWGTLALALAFSAGPLACSGGAGNNGTSNPGGLGGTVGVVDTGGVQTGGGQATICGTCSAGLANWAEWPVPNGPVDVTAGAPNLESYTDNGDGTVTDNVTGLMWQQVVPATRYVWAGAVSYCPTLTLAGHSDWRLPSVIELSSIVDLGQSYPSINPTYFPSTPSDFFWSASPLAGSSSDAWFVYFVYGYTYNFDISNAGFVRCVR